MTIRSFFALFTSTLLVLAACSDDDLDAGTAATAASGTQGKAITAERLAQFCTKNVERQTACSSTPDTLEECKKDYNCFGAYIRSEALEPLLVCLETRGCDKSDDTCFKEVAAGLTLPPQTKDYESACKTKLAECGTANPGGFSDDWCTSGDIPWPLFPTSFYDRLTPCFSKPCAEIRACLDQLDEGGFERSLCTVP